MIKRLKIRPQARQDIEEAIDWLKAENPRVAQDFVEELETCFARVADFPEIGTLRAYRHSLLQGVRMTPLRRFKRYLVFYHLTAEEVEVIRLLHGARDIDAIFAAGEGHEDSA